MTLCSWDSGNIVWKPIKGFVSCKGEVNSIIYATRVDEKRMYAVLSIDEEVVGDGTANDVKIWR